MSQESKFSNQTRGRGIFSVNVWVGSMVESQRERLLRRKLPTVLRQAFKPGRWMIQIGQGLGPNSMVMAEGSGGAFAAPAKKALRRNNPWILLADRASPSWLW